jgi:signal transduction histidine kinase
MNLLLNQIITLLTSETGSLAYHILMAALLIWALLVSVSQPPSSSSALRRTVLGLSALLATQFALFFLSGLVWQGLPGAANWLPVLDRGVMLFGLATLIWLWAFAQPSPGGDSSAVLVALLIIAGVVLGGLSWTEQAVGSSFNHSMVDQASQAAALVLIAVGVLLLLIRRQAGWVFGLGMLILLSPGHLLHLLMGPLEGDYAGAVRLSQLTALSFLLMLPQRFVTPTAGPSTTAGQAHLPVSDAERAVASPQTWNALQKLIQESQPERARQAVVAGMAQISQADICMLVYPPDENGQVLIASAFDQAHNRYFESQSIETHNLPAFTSALRIGRIRRLNSHTASSDLPELARFFNLSDTGNVLFLPALTIDGKTLASLILMSPFSGRDWTAEEQALLSNIARPMVYFLQRIDEMNATQEEISQVRQAARTSQEHAGQALEERRKLLDQLTALRNENQRNRDQLQNFTGLLNEQMAAHQTIQSLHSDLDQLRRQNQELVESKERLEQKLRVSTASLNKGSTAEAELRLALQEIAYLQTLLAEADRRLSSLKVAQIESSPLKSQMDEMIGIAQDLRQPLSSIMGYVDFLLSESVGILGAMQRKYLERIRISVERMSRLVNDLVQSAEVDRSIAQVEMSDFDLGMVLQSAIAESGKTLRQKNITLQLDLGQTPMRVFTDQYVLRKTLTSLLDNAAQVTPEGSVVTLSARLQNADGHEDYVLVQISDKGGGIAVKDLPRVFSVRQPGEQITGVSNGSLDLSSIKTVIEIMNGRAWVDSDEGQGATFSLLLPVAAASARGLATVGV